ncbi:MAG: tetratricopeptide (TPR) repeat protein, partial [Rhodothermales bacterium]
MARKRKSKSPAAESANANSALRGEQRRWMAIGAALIVVASLAIYARTVSYGFTNWDDPLLILDNLEVRSLAPSRVAGIFTPKPGFTYQPVRVLSYAIDYALWGGYNPTAFHAMNLLLHSLAGLLLALAVFAILGRLKPDAEFKTRASVALFVALLFVVHPVNTESVAWAASRKYGLIAVFGFLSFWLYVRQQTIASFAAFIVALLSSPFAIVLPPIFLLFEYCREPELSPVPIAKRRWKNFLPYIIAFALAAPFLAFQLLASDRGEGGISTTHHADNPLYTIFSMLRAFGDYLKNLVMPFWLNNRYPNHVATMFFRPGVLIGALLLGLTIFWVSRELRAGRKLPLFCAGWFFICLAPVSNIIPISNLMADRYLYLAGIGPFLALGLTLAAFLRTPQLRYAIGGVILLAFTIGASARVGVWKDSESLWRDCLAKDKRNDIALNNMGNSLKEQLRHAESVPFYEACLKLNPDYTDAHTNLGAALMELGQPDAAMKHYQEALKQKPDHALTRFNLGVAYAGKGNFKQAIEHYALSVEHEADNPKFHTNYGAALYELRDYDGAQREYEAALELDPSLPEANSNIGNVYYIKKLWKEAEAAYGRARDGNPELVEPYINLADIARAQGDMALCLQRYQEAAKRFPEDARPLTKMGDVHRHSGDAESAKAAYQQALQRSPKAIDAYLGLAEIAKTAGDKAGVIAQFEAALAVNPDHFAVHSHLGSIHFDAGDTGKAIHHFGEMVRVNPRSAEAFNNLASCYFSSKDYEKAITNYTSAIRLNPNYAQAH